MLSKKFISNITKNVDKSANDFGLTKGRNSGMNYSLANVE